MHIELLERANSSQDHEDSLQTLHFPTSLPDQEWPALIHKRLQLLATVRRGHKRNRKVAAVAADLLLLRHAAEEFSFTAIKQGAM